MSRAYRGRLGNAALQEPGFYDALRSSDDVEMALVVRAARNLPIRLLAGEYERILKRRLARVGGSPDDAALGRMVTCFTYALLPLHNLKEHTALCQSTCVMEVLSMTGRCRDFRLTSLCNEHYRSNYVSEIHSCMSLTSTEARVLLHWSSPCQCAQHDYLQASYQQRSLAMNPWANRGMLALRMRVHREEALPEAIKDGRSVRKGTVLTFTRDREGNLAARADAHELACVQSRPLCAAIFDLYIGEQPVSKKAKVGRLLLPCIWLWKRWHARALLMLMRTTSEYGTVDRLAVLCWHNLMGGGTQLVAE